MHLLILRTGAVLVVWLDGRAIRVERDGSGAAGVRKIACITRRDVYTVITASTQ